MTTVIFNALVLIVHYVKVLLNIKTLLKLARERERCAGIDDK